MIDQLGVLDRTWSKLPGSAEDGLVDFGQTHR
jgi:hypothetical protein